MSQYTLRSPDMLAPARIPVAAGKNTANTMKKFSMSEAPPNALKLGTKLVRNVFPEDKIIITIILLTAYNKCYQLHTYPKVCGLVWGLQIEKLKFTQAFV